MIIIKNSAPAEFHTIYFYKLNYNPLIELFHNNSHVLISAA